MLFKKPINPADDARLSELIRLKKRERPDEAFWDQFDRELRNRQLTALFQRKSWKERLGSMALVALRKSAVFAAAASVLALGLFTAHKAGWFPGAHIESESQAAETAAIPGAAPKVDTPIFIVEKSAAAPGEVAMDYSPVFFGSPSYEVRRITKQSVPVSYQIMAEPKQFRASQPLTEQQSLGAKVIRTGIHF
jgi:hypothetical protein